jgi:hypothetical protein
MFERLHKNSAVYRAAVNSAWLAANHDVRTPHCCLQDVVVGKIYFLLVRIKLKHMEVEIRRRETTGEPQQQQQQQHSASLMAVLL